MNSIADFVDSTMKTYVVLLAMAVLVIECVSLPMTENRSHKRVKRIVGGQEVDPHEFPFLVALAVRLDREAGTPHYRYVCAGAIIDERHVVTAAHCMSLVGRLRHSYHVLPAAHKLLYEDSELFVGVEKVTVHVNYENIITYRNDIAVLRLEKNLDFCQNVSAIRLNRNPRCPADLQRCTVAGWGAIRTDYPSTDTPLKVDIPVFNASACGDIYKGYNFPINDRRQICTLDPSGGKDACTGDSGGPLFCWCGGLKPKLVGVVSVGIGCGIKDIPSIYTRVSAYRDWIEDVLDD